MPRRTVLVLILDSTMLALVCVLECLDLTGLELHEWFGFALCPLVLIHVVWQWPWFVNQYRKCLRGPGARIRVNALLNTLLLFLMSAVLLSGVLNSRQGISLFGERFGSVRVWRELHGWLNFTLLVWVALHLGLNWDWLVGVFTKRGREPALRAEEPLSNSFGRQPYSIRPGRAFQRGLAILAAAILCAGIAYVAMAALLGPPKHRQARRSTSQVQVDGPASAGQLVPRPRPARFSHGFEQVSVTSGLVLLVVLFGRYVLRLRL